VFDSLALSGSYRIIINSQNYEMPLSAYQQNRFFFGGDKPGEKNPPNKHLSLCIPVAIFA